MSAPIGNTCPNIDKAIRRLDPLIKQINKMKSYDYENAKYMQDFLSDCAYEMDSVIGALEDLRKDNDTLRSWGREMEKEAETLQVRVNELEEQLNELQS